jgi:DNA-directed RNA polymerase specialized sigma24 family protein
MPSDLRLAAVRNHHRAAARSREDTQRHLAERNRLIRLLYAEGDLSYGDIAKATGVPYALVAKIVAGAKP